MCGVVGVCMHLEGYAAEPSWLRCLLLQQQLLLLLLQ